MPVSWSNELPNAMNTYQFYFVSIGTMDRMWLWSSNNRIKVCHHEKAVCALIINRHQQCTHTLLSYSKHSQTTSLYLKTTMKSVL